MKIAFVTAEYPPKNIGGAGISSELIVNGVRELGPDVDVYSLTGKKSETKKITSQHYSLYDGSGYPVPTEIGINITILQNLPDLKEYDVVHSYNTGHLPAVVARVDPPVVATINNHMWVCIDPTRFLKQGCPEQNLLKQFEYAKSSGYTGLKRFGRVGLELAGKNFTKKSDCITVQNEGMKRVLTSCDYPPDNINIVPNLVDSRFFVENKTTKNEKNKLVFLGRLEPYKGAYSVAQAFTKLPTNILENWELHIYGKGAQKSEINGLISESQEEADIKLKYARYSELPQVYSTADAVIHASKYTEPFSRVWLESMASGTPLICSRNPSSESVLSDIAVLYSPFNKNEPRNTLRDTLVRDDLPSIGRKGKQHVQEYLPSKVCPQYIKLYKEVM